ncbi:bleomycin resistance protein [Pseudomonas zhanjiangensis]|uniref:Bleomycin resistance protein n=1 Tax=Pseudomonas zhanjiangensis TaxID=3239015 RepID=A0ABV3Z2K5_9PSED
MQWNALVPELLVVDYPAAKAFYREVFGFQLRFERAEDRFGYFEREGAQLMLLQAPGAVSCGLDQPGPKGKGLHFQVEVAALDELLARLEAADIELTTAVSDFWYRVDEIEHGQREFFVADLDGYLFRFFQHLGERPARGGNSSEVLAASVPSAQEASVCPSSAPG